MSIQQVNFQSKVQLPLSACAPVTLCLTSEWANRTVSGATTIRAVVANTHRVLGRGQAVKGLEFSPRGEEIIQYSLDIDDSQFLIDGTTSLPFVLTCADISEINPYDCTVQSFESETLWSPNLLTFGSEFDNAVWTKTRLTVVPDAIPGPDGFLIADSLIPTVDNNSHLLYQTVSIVSGRLYRFDLVVHTLDGGGGGDYHLGMRLDNAGFPNNTYATFDLINGTAAATANGATATIEDLNGGWYRCTIFQTADATVGGVPIIANVVDTAANTAGIPDGIVFVGNTTDGIYAVDAEVHYKL